MLPGNPGIKKLQVHFYSHYSDGFRSRAQVFLCVCSFLRFSTIYVSFCIFLHAIVNVVVMWI